MATTATTTTGTTGTSSDDTLSSNYTGGSVDIDVRVFGDVLRHSLATRQEQGQQDDSSPPPSGILQQFIPRKFFAFSKKKKKNNNNNDEETANNGVSTSSSNEDDKSISTVHTTTSFDDDDDDVTFWDVTTQNAVSLVMKFIICFLPWLIITTNNSTTKVGDEELGLKKPINCKSIVSWRVNWDRIITVLSILIAIEVVCVIGLTVGYIILSVSNFRMTTTG
jgi:hypothetical protein